MFRTDYGISDKKFDKIVRPHDQLVKEHLYNNVLFDFIAFYIAKGYELDALWEGNLIGHVNAAIESLSCVIFKEDFDSTKLKKIFKKKYGLTIINENPLMFEENKIFNHKKKT